MILLLWALAQDADVERLIRRLDADDIAVRDEALRALIEAGDPARAAVEKLLGSDNPELAARAAAIVRGIDERARLRGILGDPRVVSIEAKDEPLVDVLRRFREQTRLPFKLRSIPGADRVTCSVSEASPAAALEKLCAAHGEIRFDPASMIVTRGTPSPYPSAHDGKFSLYLTGIDIDRYADGGSYNHASLRLVHDTPASPYRVTLATASVVDDRGNSVLEADNGGVMFLDTPMSPVGDADPVRDLEQYLLAPDAEATALSFKGTVEIEYELERDVFAFDNPSEAVGRTQTAGDVSVTLAAFGGGSISVQVTGPTSIFGDTSALEGGRIELVTEGDQRLRVEAYLSSVSESADSVTAILEGYGGLGAGLKVKRLDVIRTRSTHRVSFPFEFKDVKIR